ncbi:MAG: DMT family transporter [Thermodesulfovibrionales bacterium]|jgi:drug/metabolite transporter (DMT)-like permease|nr:DMT family transporter [Thermodesulfovibrionales bacterium]
MSKNINHNYYNQVRYGVMAALLSAALFGTGTPIAKLLLGEVPPLLLAGLLYLGSGAGLSLLAVMRRLTPGGHTLHNEPDLGGSDYLYLSAAIFCGGIAAPVLLIYGLSKTSASTASLLLNMEGLLTTLIASLIFKESVGRRIWLAAFLMLAASLSLTYMPDSGGWSLQSGSILVMLACLMWAFDNNITRHLSHRDPFAIARYKGLVAGFTTLLAAFVIGNQMPSILLSTGAFILGALSYGASLVLFVYALRNLGTSRTSVYFGAAPFIGAIVSVTLLDEQITIQLFAAMFLMLSGIALIFKEYHEHEHLHEESCHEHRHIHDEHHNHEHEDVCSEPHCHEHEHGLLTHSHAHVPDIHHYHGHGSKV